MDEEVDSLTDVLLTGVVKALGNAGLGHPLIEEGEGVCDVGELTGAGLELRGSVSPRSPTTSLIKFSDMVTDTRSAPGA